MTAALCPKCGIALPANAPEGLCRPCLLEQALASTDESPTQVNPPSAEEAGQLQGSPGLGSFGDYELLEEIARGGMGVVYKARQKGLNRVVAVKLILAGQFAGKQHVQRFRAEATAAAILQHPNIVAVHEVGTHNGQHFFSMDYVEGQNLAHFVGNNPLPPHQAARYVQLISEAIHHAHQLGILHRDLKPSNVIIDAATDQPRVTDFGLAKRLDGESSITVTGQVLGSPNFMPPEQASASRGKEGRHSDVYGLGAILYYTLSARAPFQGATLETTIHEVLNAEPLSPRALNPSLPRDLETICLKCLEKESSRRYQTAQELADELGRYLRDEPIHSRPVSRTERAWRWCRRKPALAGSLGAGAILLLIVAIGSPIAALRISRAAVALRQSLYVADMNNASAAIQQRRFGRAKQLLEQYLSPASENQDLRGIEWRMLWQQCQPDFDFSFAGHTDNITCAVFSPDGNWLATAGMDRTVQVWDRPSRQRVRTLTGFEDFIDWKAVAFSPDSKLLVAKGGRRLRAWRVGEWAEVGASLTLASNWNVNNAVAFSPHGLTLATRIAGGVGFVDVRRWQTNELLLSGKDSLGTVLKYSPDGQFLFLSDWHELVVREAHAPLRTVTTLSRKDGAPDWRILSIAASENHLAAGFRDGIVTVWDRKDWQELISFQAQASSIYDLAFSPDGTLLVTCGEEHAIQVWRMEELVSGLPFREPHASFLKGHSGAVNSLMFAADGRTLLSGSADLTAKLWDISKPRSQPGLAASDRPLWFSPDSTKLLVAHTNSQVHFWNVAERLNLGQTDPPLDAAQVRAVSPDGALVAVTPRTNRLEVRNFQTGQVVRQWESPESKFSAVHAGRDASFAAKPPERRLAFATTEGSVKTYWVWKVDSDQLPTRVGTGSRGPVLSRDGKLLAHPDGKGGILLHHLTAGETRLIPAGPQDINSLAISWDGALLAAVYEFSPDIRFWETRSGRELPPLRQVQTLATVVEFTPDGKSLITCTLDGDVQFWDFALRKELAMLVNRRLMTYFLLLSPDGSSLACPAPNAFAKRGYVNVWRLPSLAEIDQMERTRAASASNPTRKGSQ